MVATTKMSSRRVRSWRRARLLACVAVLTACGSSPAPPVPRGAEVVDELRVAPNLVDLTVRSPALGRTARVRLLTPRGWERRRAGQRWPVLYLLHGCCDTYESWTRETDVEELPQLRDTLVVMPEGGAAGWYSDWWNRGAGGPPRWETFHLVELRRLLERRYGAGPRRAIAACRLAASARSSTPPATRACSGPRRIWEAHDPTALAARLRGTRLFVSAGDGRPGPLDSGGGSDPIEAFIHRENLALARRLRAADPGEARLLRAGHASLAVLRARAAPLAAAAYGDSPR